MLAQREELIPQGLRRHRQPGPEHLPDLSRQRHVIRVLGDGNGRREADRVAPAGDELGRAEGRIHASAALARVLLALVPGDLEGPLDDLDLLGLLELPVHLGELAAA